MYKITHGNELLLETIESIRNPVRGIPIQDFPEWSDLMGGFRPNELTIFCGGTGTGKTQILAALSASLLKSRQNVFCAPVEVGHTSFTKRVLSAFGGHDFSNCDLSHDIPLMNTLRSSQDYLLEHLFLSTHDNRVDVEEMVNTIEFMQNTQDVKVAVLDNLNFFLKASSSRDQNLAYDEAIHAFVMAVKKINIHIILVMHPRKTDEGKVLSEFDIKGSSTAVQEAANVLLFNRPNEKDLEDGMRITQRELVFRKLRERGSNVFKKFYLDFNGGKYVQSNNERGNGRENIRDTKARVTWNKSKQAGLPFKD
jgi:replicative DNA helicase